MSVYTRRDALLGSVGALAGAALVDPRRAPAEAATGASAPKLEVEKGAVLRVMRPSKFVAGDEQLFMQEHAEVHRKGRASSKGRDAVPGRTSGRRLRSPPTSARGPDIVLWPGSTTPHQYPDKLARPHGGWRPDHQGDKYGGWFSCRRGLYGRTQDGRWICDARSAPAAAASPTANPG